MFTLAVWMPPRGKPQLQYLAGLAIYIFTGPFLCICVLLYTTYHLDSFGWGKTRQIATPEPKDDENDTTAEKDRTSTTKDEEATIGVVQ